MAYSYKDRLVTTVSAVASSGSGDFTVSAASSSYQTFGSGDDGLTFEVTALEGTAWEVFEGTYTHSGTSLSRGTLIASSTGSRVTFTTAAVLTATPSATTLNLLAQQLDRAETLVTTNGSTSQTFGATATKIAALFATVTSNPRSEWDTTNKKFLPTRDGNYLVFASLQTTGSVALQVQVYKNGSSAFVGAYGAAASYQVSTVSGVISLNGSSDYVEIYGYQSASVSLNAAAAANNFAKFIYLG